ncbi:ATPase, AAA family [Formosa agariphila KMM 3901]|uniref:ATPase, AAA family n=1 Tax=Formosa agariphila (strain DSM 15362 / KCTC 12365 / LMG 23005 / KMM 3901 / M-2Alg 35-1) TaxID=1347342 RepID=T2KJB6_FORAG|nr:ATP-binding protein [Formosa agariphila]CDF78860.1 ATPase, AAA family [Formosa agariphila KMM 3901]
MKTKKIVITGGPGTGKSSIINELQKKGYSCLEEISRQVTLQAREEGIEQMFLTEPLLFSERLLKGRKAQFYEANTSIQPCVFLDRGVHDVLAYMDFIGDKYPETFKNVCDSLAYDHIFILKPWKEIYKSDAVRYENFEQALQIHECLVNTYEGFNYTLIDVPFDTVENRADYILNEIKTL